MSKNKQKENRRGIVEYLSVKAELPSDALAGEVRIELRGKNSLFIGGCKRIITYSTRLIVLGIKGDVVSVKGERLICTSYHSGTVSIEGSILSVSFGNGGEE